MNIVRKFKLEKLGYYQFLENEQKLFDIIILGFPLCENNYKIINFMYNIFSNITYDEREISIQFFYKNTYIFKYNKKIMELCIGYFFMSSIQEFGDHINISGLCNIVR